MILSNLTRNPDGGAAACSGPANRWRPNRGALHLAPIAGDVGRAEASLAMPPVSMTERRDGACVSGGTVAEGRHAA